MAAYREVVGRPAVRRILWLSLLVRVPLWAANVVLTLHVVTHLHRSYGAAGLLAGAATVAAAISGPWRGRRLDRVGLRRTLAPSIVVGALCWSVAPFLDYWPLLVLATVADLMIVPSFSIVRQALMAAVEDSQRKTVLAVDSVAVEITFMIGPALGVLLAGYAPTSWALFCCELASLVGAALLWLGNPALRPPAATRTSTADGAVPAADAETAGEAAPARGHSWLGVEAIAVLVMAGASTVVLTGTDVSIVAVLRTLHHQSWIGWELAVWGLGSAIGGLVYGALHRTVPVAVLLGLLCVTTLPVALANDAAVVAVLLLVAGLCCAPTITASVDALSRVVPEHARGEALGWHGSAMTAGSAVGAPVAGLAIDAAGWRGGFVIPTLIALAAALGGGVAVRRRARRGPPTVSSATAQPAVGELLDVPVPDAAESFGPAAVADGQSRAGIT